MRSRTALFTLLLMTQTGGLWAQPLGQSLGAADPSQQLQSPGIRRDSPFSGVATLDPAPDPVIQDRSNGADAKASPDPDSESSIDPSARTTTVIRSEAEDAALNKSSATSSRASPSTLSEAAVPSKEASTGSRMSYIRRKIEEIRQRRQGRKPTSTNDSGR